MDNEGVGGSHGGRVADVRLVGSSCGARNKWSSPGCRAREP